MSGMPAEVVARSSGEVGQTRRVRLTAMMMASLGIR